MIGLTLRRLYRRIRQSTKGYPSFGWTSVPREEILWLSLTYIGSNKLIGDYSEFGVWRGNTFATACHLAKNLATSFRTLSSMRFHAFDSFEGFPEPQGDDVCPLIQKGGRSCSLDQFKTHIARLQVPMGRITVTKGWFSDTLRLGAAGDRLIADQSLAIAYVDCDLYESTRDVLSYLKRKMMPGGVIIFDDWFLFAAHPLKGEQKACREFLVTNPGIVFVPFQRFGWHGHSFIFHALDKEQRERYQGVLP